MKIQITDGKGVRQNIAECCKQTFEYKMFVDNTQQCFAFTPKANFRAIIWIFTEGEGDEIESRLPFKIFSTLLTYLDQKLPSSPKSL